MSSFDILCASLNIYLVLNLRRTSFLWHVQRFLSLTLPFDCGIWGLDIVKGSVCADIVLSVERYTWSLKGDAGYRLRDDRNQKFLAHCRNSRTRFFHSPHQYAMSPRTSPILYRVFWQKTMKDTFMFLDTTLLVFEAEVLVRNMNSVFK